MKKAVVLFSLFTLFAQLVSCGSGTGADTTDSTGTETPQLSAEPTEIKPDYIYPAANYNGHEFVFLNQDKCDWANRLLVPEETNGELINDAMYNRNMRIEERYNIKITEVASSNSAMPSMIKNAVNAGDDIYDAAMCSIGLVGNMMLENYFVELTGISSLNLDKPWWDQAVIEAATLNGRCYLASSDISFFPFEATWVVYFNEKLFNDLSAELPYQLVREGKWTIDKLTEYSKLGASLNGQESFVYSESGTAVYGMCTHGQFVEALVFGAGETLLKTDGGIPKFNGGSDKMYSIYEKIASLTKNEGVFLDNAKRTDVDKPLSLSFKRDCFLFFAETLGHLNNLRDYNGDFGVVPVPKFDEAQDGYHSMMASAGTLMTTIPATSSDPGRTGVILDALAYDSYKNLMEPYYDTYLTQKGVRNEDSAEMLRLVRDTRTINVGKMFGWTSAVFSDITSKLMSGSSDIASTIAADSPAVSAAIEKTLSMYSK